MKQRSFLLPFALLAAAAAAIFLAISVDQSVYAPGSYKIRKEIAHTGVARAERHLPAVAQRWLAPSKVLRKAYSVVAFAIVGFFVAPLLRRRSRLRDDAAVVAGFSTLIEIAQKIFDASPESYASNLFDILCGALGGLLGAVGWNALTSRFFPDGEVR